MCTVTFVPTPAGCLLTSSRDESIGRAKALPPAEYTPYGMKMICPKDSLAGGSWIACTQTGNAAVLLNGAFVKHVSTPPYRKSRGLVFLEIVSQAQPEFSFLGMNLNNIEPFTLVLIINGLLFEARWDGTKKYFSQLDASSAHIWSSATLYDPAATAKKEQWFETWLDQVKQPAVADIFNFHRFAGDGDPCNSVLMNRNNAMLTVSITLMDIRTDDAVMHHYDVQEQETFVKSLTTGLAVV